MILSLPLSLPDATPIGDQHAMQTRDGITYYFYNLEPYDCHPAGDRRAMLLRAAKLQVVSRVRQRDLMRAFQVSRPTVARAVRRYREHGEDAFYEPLRRRGRTVVDAELADKATNLLASGMSGNACARQLASQRPRSKRTAAPASSSTPRRRTPGAWTFRKRTKLRSPIMPPAWTLHRHTKLRPPIAPPATPATSKRPWAARHATSRAARSPAPAC